MTETNAAYDPPGPGSWTLDAGHCSKPRSRYLNDLFERAYSHGLRAGFERYGAMLDTIEYAAVHGFPYTSVRPLGSPPGARNVPPRFVLKLLARFHPALRRRIRRAEAVMRERPWREDYREFHERTAPNAEAALLAFANEPIERANLDDFLPHLDAVRDAAHHTLFEHFRLAGGSMLPVGDFIGSVVAWTGCATEEALTVLRGASPSSVDAVRELDDVAAVLGSDACARTILRGDGPARRRLAELCALEGATGRAVRRWLERVGHRIVTGPDVSELTAIELPELLLATLAAHLEQGRGDHDETPVEAEAKALRKRVPAPHRDEFDALLEEARLAYSLRDARCIYDYWHLGVLRRALLEGGRRLVAAGRLERDEHAVDLTHAEIAAMLRGGAGPSAADTAAHATRRRNTSVREAPDLLGPPPAPPPDTDWLPSSAARIQRAFQVYLDGVLGESRAPREAPVVRGMPASAGRFVGVARLVLAPSDYERVERGDVLVAWMTTPTYNVLLPLLGAIVTDRGGLLSHAAIVSREFGIPAVVGCRDATERIADGARVEVDGDRGTVRVLA